MRIYTHEGILTETSEIESRYAKFCIQEINDLDSAIRFTYPGDSLYGELNDELVILYDTFRDAVFEDVSSVCSISHLKNGNAL